MLSTEKHKRVEVRKLVDNGLLNSYYMKLAEQIAEVKYNQAPLDIVYSNLHEILLRAVSIGIAHAEGKRVTTNYGIRESHTKQNIR